MDEKESKHLRPPGKSMEELLGGGELGAVLSRAGVGKTSILVQVGLCGALRERKVLHVSLGDPVKKIHLWYKELFRNLTAQDDATTKAQLWEKVLKQRFIMTFKAENFTVSTLEERLDELREQDIFSPDMVLLDGLSIESDAGEILSCLKPLLKKQGVSGWLAARTHRDEKPGPDGLPDAIRPVTDLFEVIVELKPAEDKVEIVLLKRATGKTDLPTLLLDPSTMMIRRADS
jgi:hypothetical protein